jgi:hypothetical protein
MVGTVHTDLEILLPLLTKESTEIMQPLKTILYIIVAVLLVAILAFSMGALAYKTALSRGGGH